MRRRFRFRWYGWVRAGGDRAGLFVLGIGGLAVVAALLVAGDVQARVALSGFGAVSLALVLFRPRFFWENGRLELWRRLLGDAGVMLLYGLIGCGMIYYAWTAPL